MVCTQRPSAHLRRWATLAGFGTISLNSGIARFVQGGVVKTVRCVTQMTDIHSLAEWLTDHNCALPAVDHQDGVWVIASAFTHVDLLPLLSRADAIPARRDCITYALIVQLECLIDASESNEPYNDETAPLALETLSEFARENWEDVLRIDAEMGFGADFDTFVVPHITSA